MNHPRVLALACVSGLTAAASAQIITTPGITANLDLTWQEDPVYPHNDNGVLEPGEHALMLMTVSFTGQNTPASFFPPIGGFSSGTVVAFAGAFVDIRSDSIDPTGLFNGGLTNPASSSAGPNAGPLGTTGYGVRGGWRLGSNYANGLPVSNGFVNVGPGQFWTNGGNVANPIANIERLGWALNDFAPRTVAFSIIPAAGAGGFPVGLEIDFDGDYHGTTYLSPAAINLGTVNIPIVPAPATLTMLGLGGWFAGRRRRRPTEVRQ